jgi:hypothetical protein
MAGPCASPTGGNSRASADPEPGGVPNATSLVIPRSAGVLRALLASADHGGDAPSSAGVDDLAKGPKPFFLSCPKCRSDDHAGSQILRASDPDGRQARRREQRPLLIFRPTDDRWARGSWVPALDRTRGPWKTRSTQLRRTTRRFASAGCVEADAASEDDRSDCARQLQDG